MNNYFGLGALSTAGNYLDAYRGSVQALESLRTLLLDVVPQLEGTALSAGNAVLASTERWLSVVAIAVVETDAAWDTVLRVQKVVKANLKAVKTLRELAKNPTGWDKPLDYLDRYANEVFLKSAKDLVNLPANAVAAGKKAALDWQKNLSQFAGTALTNYRILMLVAGVGLTLGLVIYLQAFLPRSR